MKNRVVVIDDDKEFLGEMEDLLIASGYETTAVNDTQTALDISKQKRPDVILMDLKMPGKSGFELADEMSRITELRDIPIIGISGFFKDEFNSFMNLCGIKSCLKKPFNSREVISAIEDAVEKSKI